MKIVQCQADDAAELLAVARQSFIDAFEKASNPDNFKAYIAKAFTPSVVAEELAHAASVFYFLKDASGETVGYAKMRWDTSDEFFPSASDGKALHLQRIYLLEKHWNKGYGRVLLDFCENYARQNDYTWIWLIVWFENHGAIRFYEREGWEKFGHKDFQFGNEIHHDFAFRKKLA
jgi:diamine N-acetyltransferase